MNGESNTHDASESQPYNFWGQTPQYAPTPGFLDRSPSFLSVHSEFPSPVEQSRSNALNLQDISEWEKGISNDEDLPTCIRYSIEWKVTINNRVVAKDTEPDLALTPSAYWDEHLKQKLEDRIRTKTRRNRRIRSEDTAIVVSVNDRSQRDLNKWFEKTDIEWTAIEQQLLKWENLFYMSKKLMLTISFNYTEDSCTTTADTTTSTNRNKRGAGSRTQRMLVDREAQLDVENPSGQPSVWENVYRLMRCPGPPCRLGQWCWQDPVGKKHYSLKTHHLTSLVKYVQDEGSVIETHDDVPNWIPEQLYAEERQKFERQLQKRPNFPGTNATPININLLASQSSHTMCADTTATPPMPPPLDVNLSNCPKIPGPRDLAVKSYSEWQESNVFDEMLKADFRKACEVAIAHGLDLEQVYKDQNPDFFIQNGVRLGISRRFVSDIIEWATQYAGNVYVGGSP